MFLIRVYGKKFQGLFGNSIHLMRLFFSNFSLDLVLRVLSPFLIHVLYFVLVSFIGFGFLKAFKPRTEFKPRNLDLYLTSVSAITVSSMSTVEMEVFSNSQLIVLTVLMFIGGEVFTSMVELYLKRSQINRNTDSFATNDHNRSPLPLNSFDDQFKLNIITIPNPSSRPFDDYNPFLKNESTKFLGFLVLAYHLGVQTFGVASVLLYLTIIPSANTILQNKGLSPYTFSAFVIASTFANCGYTPTNENMMVFSKNSGLLWILIPQVLLGNTLFPSALRFLIWVLGNYFKKQEARYLLENPSEAGYLHLLPRVHSLFLVPTVLGFIFISFILFCGLEWNSAGLSGLNPYQKFVGVLFQCVNARHTGENIIDLSTIAPAILVLFVVMMYLPPHTSFLPINKNEEVRGSDGKEMWKKKKRIAENFILSQLSYLVMFILLICVTERKSLKEDPLNFSVLHIVVEVISAYGNVGFTTGYSCERQIRKDPNCVNKWYGFSGKWSDEGKIILIIVMFYGRLKKFNMNGGQSWKLL